MAKSDVVSEMDLEREANDLLDSMREFIADHPEFEVVELTAVAMRDDGELFVQEISVLPPQERLKVIDCLMANIEDETIEQAEKIEKIEKIEH